jgi:hypothetical protein
MEFIKMSVLGAINSNNDIINSSRVQTESSELLDARFSFSNQISTIGAAGLKLTQNDTMAETGARDTFK